MNASDTIASVLVVIVLAAAAALVLTLLEEPAATPDVPRYRTTIVSV